MDPAWITYGVPVGAMIMALGGLALAYSISRSFDRRYPFTEVQYLGITEQKREAGASRDVPDHDPSIG